MYSGDVEITAKGNDRIKFASAQRNFLVYRYICSVFARNNIGCVDGNSDFTEIIKCLQYAGTPPGLTSVLLQSSIQPVSDAGIIAKTRGSDAGNSTRTKRGRLRMRAGRDMQIN